MYHRRSIRLKSFNYAQAGGYYVTICTHNRECLFGDVIDGNMCLNAYGEIAFATWTDLTERFPLIELDEFVVMPNHIHGIIRIVGASLADAQGNTHVTRATTRVAPTLGAIVGAYKSISAVGCQNMMKRNGVGSSIGKIWQRNYYEHILRNERELAECRQYIANNPLRWYYHELECRE